VFEEQIRMFLINSDYLNSDCALLHLFLNNNNNCNNLQLLLQLLLSKLIIHFPLIRPMHAILF